MARAINRLSARTVQTLTEPGRHADGDGLYLVVDEGGGKRWVYLYRLAGRRREMGLGPLRTVSLAQAREQAGRARALAAQGQDPVEARQAAAPLPESEPARTAPTFGQVADTFMDSRAADWRNAKHRQQWRNTLTTYAADLWVKPVSEIETPDVLAALRPIWREKPETATRVRGRIERILDAAKVEGHREGENPARWRGHLEHTLPKPGKLSRGHHTAMPYAEVPAFLTSLRERPGDSARALELLILTAARSGEIRGMRADEADLESAVWTVPAERMKGGRTHRVPLSRAALDLLAPRLAAIGQDDLVFTNTKGGMLSDMVFEALYRRAKVDGVTTHGFRSSFRDWVGDETEFPREIAEAALAHLVGDEVELAYGRGDALEKRRQLMDLWASFVAAESGAASRKASRSR
ncbi:integrase arm-type DNA-binding domain-containing protein [Methylobacterium sp. E-005]|uniref:tyrosine-type recombinase/integrase n=1 Tax=Methylobacterium sp. E-005 TaxID=2836549 RepID=UPI001FB98D76|nr:site-specific integrase [Methylobacterium sp. E-005]MCJ2088372.1 integrase arm-type DNA-binding domain-containing protein [Methylobacterium sp. E-005]